jgi:hypothetical protein
VEALEAGKVGVSELVLATALSREAWYKCVRVCVRACVRACVRVCACACACARSTSSHVALVAHVCHTDADLC